VSKSQIPLGRFCWREKSLCDSPTAQKANAFVDKNKRIVDRCSAGIAPPDCCGCENSFRWLGKGHGRCCALETTENKGKFFVEEKKMKENFLF